MKPARERLSKGRPQTEARECLTGPTLGKSNGAIPDALRYTILMIAIVVSNLQLCHTR